MARIIPDKFAVMTVDPGKTSGCSQGVFRTDKGDDMLTTVFARAVGKKQVHSWDEKGESEDQSWAICDRWSAFLFKCNVDYAIPLPYIYLVIEDFALRELQAQLQSVAVIAGIKTLLCRKLDPKSANEQAFVRWPLGRPTFQTPSTAKRRTNAMLKQLGILEGSVHERDARRHLVAKVNDVLDGKS
jgi:hypothetical protein